jgi:hypothetical protein
MMTDLNPKPALLQVPISVGELVDKITILQIKQNHLSAIALANVQRELELLELVLVNSGVAPAPVDVAELARVNRALWDIEDELREHERRSCFDETFIELARSVYFRNDERAAIKRRINQDCGSLLVEEKAYQQYG